MNETEQLQLQTLAAFFVTPDAGQPTHDPKTLGDPADWPDGWPAVIQCLQAGIEPVLSPAQQAELFAHDPNGKPSPAPIRHTDLGNARRLVAQHGQDLRFCAALGGWLCWDGQRWAPDDGGEVERRAKATVATLFVEAGAMPRGTKNLEAASDAAWRFAHASESARALAAMRTLAWSEPGIPMRPEDFDADPWLLNCANGTLDLRTGELRAHDRADMITRLAPVAYDPNATHPILDRYLADTTRGDADFIAYLQRAAGYSLTGLTTEECFFLVLGPAASGKSSLVESLLVLLGDYAVKSSFDAFLEHGSNVGGATPELARLRGARLVAASETSKARQLNEVAVKELTGGDSVTCRNLYAPPFTYRPQFKLWLACNESPKLTDTDSGLWRRLQRLPFEHELPEDARDPAVKAALQGDALPAVLAWAVRGCLDWQRQGLRPAPVVRAATVALRVDFDPLAEFFSEMCVFARAAETPGQELRQAYESWASDNGAKPIGNREWGQRLQAKGCQKLRRRDAGGRSMVWRGVGIVADSGQDGQDGSLFRESIYTREIQEDFLENAVCPAHDGQSDPAPDNSSQEPAEPVTVKPWIDGPKRAGISKTRLQELIDQGHTRADAEYIALAESESEVAP
jgi:putative DNA primase/helicase